MKLGTKIIIGVVLTIGVSIFFLNYYVSEREYESRNTSDQLRAILVSCACVSKINTYPEPDDLCIGRVGSWQNSTHYIDNNICEFITLEEHGDLEEIELENEN
jgi:hypothetical protein